MTKLFQNSFVTEIVCKEIIKAKSYNGQIYDIIINFFKELQRIDLNINRFETLINTEKSDIKIQRFEKMYFYNIEQREKISENVHNYLVQISDSFLKFI